MVDIRYDRREGSRVWVRDDGIDIDDEVIRIKPPARHFGLHGTGERAKAVGGRLEVYLSILAAAAYAPPRGTALSRLPARPRLPDDGLAL
jgi:hypothetical protein